MFKDPDTGRNFKADSENELIKLITKYRAINELPPIEHLDVVLENYWCMLPENAGSCKPREMKRGLFKTLRGGVAVVTSLLYKQMVSRHEAELRAAQCVQCKYNVFPDKGAFVEWSDEIALHSTDGRKVSVHDKLGNCEVCTCPLKAKVHYYGKVSLSPEEREQMKEVDCWQLKLPE